MLIFDKPRWSVEAFPIKSWYLNWELLGYNTAKKRIYFSHILLDGAFNYIGIGLIL